MKVDDSTKKNPNVLWMNYLVLKLRKQNLLIKQKEVTRGTHTWDPSAWETEAGEFVASLGYIVRSCLKNKYKNK
jgi:hypothetical protein